MFLYKYVVKPFLLSLSLLTRIPVRTGDADDADWGRSAAYFPLCGYILAAIAALPFMAMAYFSSNANANYAIIAIGDFLFVAGIAWMTGMFHIDGFCDACDAFTSTAATKEDRLKIMKDPHPGAAAVAYLIFLVAGKLVMFFFVIVIAEIHVTERFVMFFKENLQQNLNLFRTCMVLGVLAFLSAIPVIARFAMLFLASISKYPREKGTGAVIVGKVPVLSIVIGALWLLPFGFFIPVTNLVVALVLSGIVVMYWKIKADRLLGGVTGDVLGACCESVELAVALGLVLPEFF
ncbi:MAG TPA: hypothetical protein DET40_09615 [Lentisphaeria bacterium]|nr:MAG: hypothetical protein A2X45_08400 [Lentisphaerae bacterium GWF2_50_93]HCE43793.1 hypothetical protein [Lentisphaeria bacterium]